MLSITSWLFSQIPQVIKNYKNRSVEGLSLLFLLNWLLGDICNFLGAVILNQMFFQKAIGAYYVLVDFTLMAQFLWYGVFGMAKNALGYTNLEVVVTESESGDREGKPGIPVVIHGLSLSPPESANSSVAGSYASSSTMDMKRKEKRAYSNGSSFGMGKTAQSMFMFATLVALTSALPGKKHVSPFATLGAVVDSKPSIVDGTSRSEEWLSIDTLGLIISWVSTSLYCTSRLPQLYKNYTRRTTAGLSITLFIAAFFGNSFYSLSLLTNPLAWSDYEPYGGGGVAGPEGSKRAEWWANTLPFFLGASGVLFQDALVYMQYLWWGDREPVDVDVLTPAPVKPKDTGKLSGWLRVTGTKGKKGVEEAESLLNADRVVVGAVYGAVNNEGL